MGIFHIFALVHFIGCVSSIYVYTMQKVETVDSSAALSWCCVQTITAQPHRIFLCAALTTFHTVSQSETTSTTERLDQGIVGSSDILMLALGGVDGRIGLFVQKPNCSEVRVSVCVVL